MKPITFTVSRIEQQAVDRFVDRHRRSGCTRGFFSVTFGTTGIGQTVSIRCDHCRKKRNVTDYGAW